MQVTEAKAFIENLIERLEQNDGSFILPGGKLTTREVSALRILAELDKLSSELTPQFQEGKEEQRTSVKLNLTCLNAKCDDEKVLCVDFGTAFSKATVWKQLDNDPIPLPIGQGISSNPLLIDSVVFIGADKISFGPRAMQEYATEGDESRMMFTSPKEILTLDYETIQNDRPSLAIDPDKAFKKKELLVLFLGFLTALTARELGVLNISSNVKRRFAAPGWGDAQPNAAGPVFNKMTTQLRRFLAEAQVLSDTFPIEKWLDGIDIQAAKTAISQLNRLSDDDLHKAPFIERPVLEVVAAASSMKEHLLNKRPQVVVVDIGAGTTDIGVFKYVGAEGAAKFASYKNGMGALEIAGNRLDDAFKDIVRKKSGLGEDSTAKPMLERHLAQNTQRYKSELFENGSVKVIVADLQEIEISLDVFMSHSIVRNFKTKFHDKVVNLLSGADGADGVSFTGVNANNYVVFTGGGGSLPFLHGVFNGGVKLTAGTAYFEKIDPRPSWWEDASDEVKAVFPQIAVSVGGASPDLPKELPTVGNTSVAHTRSIQPIYKE